MNPKELQAEIQKLHARSKELLEEVSKTEDRSWTAEQDQEWDRIHSQIVEHEKNLERALQAEGRDTRYPEPESRTRGAFDGAGDGGEPDGAEERTKKASDAFTRYLRHGESRLSAEERDLLEWRGAEERAVQGTTPDAAGGYLVPEGFSGRLEVALKQFGGLMSAGITILRTESGNRLPWPTMDDTSGMGYIIGENVADTESDITLGNVTFDAYTYTSGIFKMPVELIQDAAIDPQRIVADAAGVRIGRRMATDIATADGASKPRGITVAAPVGKTTAANNAIAYAELVDMQHSVDPAYRLGGRWVFSDSVFAVLRKIVDGDGRPIWQPAAVSGMAGGPPAVILGAPYTVDNSFPAFAADTVAAIYGDLSKYVLREVRGTTAITLRERYAEYRQVGYSVFMRADGDLIDAGQGPVKSLKMLA